MNEIFPLLLLLGAFSGFIAGLLGIGGGIIIVPVLLYLLAPTISQSVLMHTVIGTTLAVTVFTSISSVYAHNRHGAILWKSFIKLMPTVLLGAFSGALIANFMSFDFLRIIFAFFVIIVALTMWFGLTTSSHLDQLSQWVWSPVGFIIGLIL